MIALVCVSAALAGPALAGVEWSPLTRADLAAGAGVGLSGTGVAEPDGTVLPPLRAFAGGAVSPGVLLLGSFGLAVDRRVTWSGEDAQGRPMGTVWSRAGIRPGFDARFYPAGPRRERPVSPYLQVGTALTIPVARARSDAWTTAEQADATEYAREDLARIGALTVRGGVGVEHRWSSGISLGAQSLLTLTTRSDGDEDAWTTRLLLAADTALVLAFDWPSPP
jgi:hypothetical protein